MAEKENKIVLEREYVVPLRRKWQAVPEFRRTPKAIKALKEFIAKHMKVEERDLRKVLLDKWLNNEMWHRGIRKPAAKLKVKAKKFEDGTVIVELVDIPEKIKWKMEKETKMKTARTVVEKKEEKKEETVEEKKKEVEKEDSMAVKEQIHAEEQHKETQHEAIKGKMKDKTTPRRMVLQK